MDDITKLKIDIQMLLKENDRLQNYFNRAKLIHDELASYKKDDRTRGLLLIKIFGKDLT